MLLLDKAPTSDPSPKDVRPAGRRSVFITIGLAIILAAWTIATAIGAANSTHLPLTATGLTQNGTVLAVLADAATVTVDLDGQLSVTNGPTSPVVARPHSGEVTSLASAGHHVVVGYADGTVLLLNIDLTVAAHTTLDGRVVALVKEQNGDVAAAYGYGQYALHYPIAILNPDTLATRSTLVVDGTVSGLTATVTGLAVGTTTGNLVLLGSDGQVTCQAQVSGQVTTVTVAEANIIVGNDAGSLTAFTGNCRQTWSTSVSTGPVRATAADGDRIYAADDIGEFVVLDAAGVITNRSLYGSAPVRALLPSAAGVLLVPQTGESAVYQPINASSGIWKYWLALGIGDAGLAGAIVIRVRRYHRALTTRATRAGLSIWQNRAAYLFCLPAVLIIGVFFYYPVASAVEKAFTNETLTSTHVSFVGFQNFIDVLHDPYFHRGLLNLLIILIASLVKTFTIPLLCAELVFWLRSKSSKRIYRTLIVLPAVVPDLVVTLLWKTIYQPEGGLLNSLLQAFGLSNWQHVWLGDTSTALTAVLFVGFPFVNAFAFLIFYGGLLQIDGQIFDAAALDGAGRLRRFISVEIPQLRPQIKIMALFSVIGAAQGFASVFVLTRGGPGQATYVPALEMYDRIGQGDISYASAIGVLLAVATLIVAGLANLRPQRRRR